MCQGMATHYVDVEDSLGVCIRATQQTTTYAPFPSCQCDARLPVATPLLPSGVPQLRQCDLSRLLSGGCWLNDEVINFYMLLIMVGQVCNAM